jgi:hypothetical protein
MAENKSKTGAIVIGVSSVLLVGVAIFFVVKALRTKPTQPQQGGGQQGGGQQGGQQDSGQQGGQQDGGNQGGGQQGGGQNPFQAIQDGFKKVFAQGGSLDKFSDWKFPIRRGQKNSSVEALQLLLLKYDNRLLPKFGADKFFGSETETALMKVIGKTKISSQADIDALKDKISTKAGQTLSQFAINQQLGIKLF